MWVGKIFPTALCNFGVDGTIRQNKIEWRKFKMVNVKDVPFLVELQDGYKIGGATFPKRDGWDFENSFSARSEDTGRRRLVFVLREHLFEQGFKGENYKRGVVWAGRGYIDITWYVDTGVWHTHDGIFESGGYETPESPMSYVEKWDYCELTGRFPEEE